VRGIRRRGSTVSLPCAPMSAMRPILAGSSNPVLRGVYRLRPGASRNRAWRRRTGIEPAKPRYSASPVLKTGRATRHLYASLGPLTGVNASAVRGPGGSRGPSKARHGGAITSRRTSHGGAVRDRARQLCGVRLRVGEFFSSVEYNLPCTGYIYRRPVQDPRASPLCRFERPLAERRLPGGTNAKGRWRFTPSPPFPCSMGWLCRKPLRHRSPCGCRGGRWIQPWRRESVAARCRLVAPSLDAAAER
jgi:hypothetical protein